MKIGRFLSELCSLRDFEFLRKLKEIDQLKKPNIHTLVTIVPLSLYSLCKGPPLVKFRISLQHFMCPFLICYIYYTMLQPKCIEIEKLLKQKIIGQDSPQ